MKNEVRLIDANALIIEKGYWHGELPDVGNPFADGVEAVDVSDIEDAPTILWESLRPKGRWIKDRDGDEYCENCSRYMPVWEVAGDPSAHNYCPNCGAKMGE